MTTSRPSTNFVPVERGRRSEKAKAYTTAVVTPRHLRTSRCQVGYSYRGQQAGVLREEKETGVILMLVAS